MLRLFSRIALRVLAFAVIFITLYSVDEVPSAGDSNGLELSHKILAVG